MTSSTLAARATAPLPAPAGGALPPARRRDSRLRAWACRHPWVLHLPVVLPLLALAASYLPYAADHTSTPDAVVAAVQLVPPLALWWRRERSRAVFGVVASTAFVQWLAGVPLNPVQLCLLVALHNVACRDEERWRRAALAVCFVGVALMAFGQPDGTVGNQLLSGALVSTVYILGVNVGLRRAYLEELEERAARLERERESLDRAAVAEERARIARELHDVLAHNVTVMVVQADGAGYALDADPAQARAAVATIADTGRSTLAEMRRLLDVLRAEDGDGLAPQPDLAAVRRLVGEARARGLPAELDLQDRAGEAAPPSVQLAAYRIIQESLTNVLRHAVEVASVVVRVREKEGAVHVEVVDDGAGAAPLGAGGHGIRGMRERAAALGGRVEAGPRDGGGFGVRAVLPVAGGRE
ncbi:sensor histidine kinase [Motilibacter aurantiacus]|uniref:sensor histidine kinase n=1 Tax=Motilibacter aurantiacus TaxID=2714955 RepID=UPI0014098B4D|nr:histidine kinase [Motilibacter aurantiacus]NHC47121.1 sensor histidine kinase [Motilibacter aurantiacus]